MKKIVFNTKKVLLTIVSIMCLFTVSLTVAYINNVTIYTTKDTQKVTVRSGDAIVFSLARKIDDISFSTDSGFTIRTLEGGVWSDMSNKASEYTPMKGYIIRNNNDENLIIDIEFSNIIDVNDSLFQKTLKAGWNLVGPAYKNDTNGIVEILDALGNSNYSHIAEFTGNGFITGDSSLVRQTYSGEAAIANISSTSNAIRKDHFQIKNNTELVNYKLLEGFAYGVFVSNDTVIPGSQNLTDNDPGNQVVEDCDEVSQLLGLCDNELVVQDCDEVSELLGLCTNFMKNPVECSSNQIFNDYSCNECYTKTGNTFGKTYLNWINPTDNKQILYKEEQIFPNMINLLPSEVTWNDSTWNYTNYIDPIYNNSEDGYILNSGNSVSLFNNTGSYYLSTDNTSTGNLEIGLLTSSISTHSILESGEISIDTNTSKSCILVKSETKVAAPANVTLSNRGNGNIKLNWDKVQSASGYNLVYYDSVTGKDDIKTISSIKNNYYEINNLESNRTYYFSVVAYNSNNTMGDFSEEYTWIYDKNCDEVNKLLGICIENNTATITNVPLANIEVVKGTSDLVALQFEIEAGEASYVTVDTINAIIENGISAATNQEVSEIKLYKTDTSSGNLLDSVSGSQITATGTIIFNGFETQIDASSTETFIVTLSTVNNDNIIGAELKVSIANTAIDISLEDNQNDTVTLDSTNLNGKIITIKGAGELSLTADANNSANENYKQILAGKTEPTIVYSADILATNEEVNIETVTFTVNENLKEVIKNAELYLDDVVIATASNSDISNEANSIITFDNISDLDIATDSTQELKLAIITEEIGFNKIGKSVQNVEITNVSISDAKGVDSGEIVTVNALTTTESNTFDVVPTIIIASLSKSLAEGRAEIRLSANSGNNTHPTSGAIPEITINKLIFNVFGDDDSYRIYETYDEGSALADAGINTNAALSPINGLTFNNNITISVAPTGNPDATYALQLDKQGIEYSVDGGAIISTKHTNDLDLGSKVY